MQDLKFISFASKAQIHFSDERVSFGLDTFQSDIHFTLAFNSTNRDGSKNEYINFHVSRNFGNPATKPKSEVVRMKKEDAEQLVEDFSKFLLQHILKPLDIDELQSKNTEPLHFISDTDFQESKFYNSVSNQFNQIIFSVSEERRKGRFYVNNNLENELEKLSPDESAFKEYCYLGKLLDEVSNEVIESDKIVSDTDLISAINFYGHWYLPKNDVPFIDLIKTFLKPQLSFKIYYRFKRAIVAVRNAGTYKEIEHLNKPVIIVKRKQSLTT